MQIKVTRKCRFTSNLLSRSARATVAGEDTGGGLLDTLELVTRLEQARAPQDLSSVPVQPWRDSGWGEHAPAGLLVLSKP